MPTFEDRGCHVISATDPYSLNLGFLDPEPLLFLPDSSSIVVRPTTSQKIWEWNPDLWICSQELSSLDHRGGVTVDMPDFIE
jgi:hypothetical protein